MFRVVVHIEINKPEDRIHVDGAGVETMVQRVLCKPRVLSDAEIELQPGAVEGRQADEHPRQHRVNMNGIRRHQCVDEQPDPRSSKYPGMLDLRYELLLLFVQSCERVADQA